MTKKYKLITLQNYIGGSSNEENSNNITKLNNFINKIISDKKNFNQKIIDENKFKQGLIDLLKQYHNDQELTFIINIILTIYNYNEDNIVDEVKLLIKDNSLLIKKIKKIDFKREFLLKTVNNIPEWLYSDIDSDINIEKITLNNIQKLNQMKKLINDTFNVL